MRIKIYHVLLLLYALGVISCVRDEFTGNETGEKEELLLQKAKLWYGENVEFAKSNVSTGMDVTRLTLDWDHKDFMKNQSGNTIISIPIESEIPGYKTGVLNFLLTQEGASLGVYKVYKESTGSTHMAWYSGTGQLIVKGFYNDEKGTFLPDDLGIGKIGDQQPQVTGSGGGYHDIEEVVIDVPRPIGSGNSGPGTGGIGGGNNPPGSGFPPYGPGWSSGGGGTNNGSYATTPCGKLKVQNTNPNFKGKVDALNKSSVFNQPHETGYAENKSGVFSDLPVSTNTSGRDALDISISSNTKGYVHAHLNDREKGTFDTEGNPEISMPIRMFSPADVDALMQMAKFVTDGNYGDIYGTMVSSSGNYTIKFTGTASNIKTGFDSDPWRNRYRTYFENEKGSPEKKFLKFLKDEMGVSGVSLYKIKSDGNSTEYKLSATGKSVEKTDCPK